MKQSYDPGIMEKISEMGHEIGYHYEDVSLMASEKEKGKRKKWDHDELIDLAYESFCENLGLFRKNFDVKKSIYPPSLFARFFLG